MTVGLLKMLYHDFLKNTLSTYIILQEDIKCKQIMSHAFLTVNILKIGTLEIINIVVLKNGTVWINNAVKPPNAADAMANSVDPDQTAPLGAV